MTIKPYKIWILLKLKLKKCKPENCPCRVCKVYIDRVGFL